MKKIVLAGFLALAFVASLGAASSAHADGMNGRTGVYSQSIGAGG